MNSENYTNGTKFRSVMPALVAGIHALISFLIKGEDDRDKPGHDDAVSHRQAPLV
jgi:hypothetical protein